MDFWKRVKHELREERARAPYGGNDPPIAKTGWAKGGLARKKKATTTTTTAKLKGVKFNFGGCEVSTDRGERINVEYRFPGVYARAYTHTHTLLHGPGNKSQINLTVRIQIYVDG